MEIPRFVYLADSLGMPVDSVGPVLWRERFNPLLAGSHRATRNDFRYLRQLRRVAHHHTWTNLSTYNALRGPYSSTRPRTSSCSASSAGSIIPHQTRTSTTELGSRFSKDVSLGGKATLYRFNSRDPGSPTGTSEIRNEFPVHRALQEDPEPRREHRAELPVQQLLDDEKPATEIKRGLTGDLNGRLRVQRGSWFSHDLSGQINGNMARSRRPNSTPNSARATRRATSAATCSCSTPRPTGST